MRSTAGAGAHAEMRPIQNVVDPGDKGVGPLFPRLRLSSPATFWNRSRFCACFGQSKNRDLFAFVAEPAKPKAQNKLTLSALARVDDKSSRSQFCVRLRLRFKFATLSMCSSYFWALP